MKVTLAKSAGFCFGVNRAVDLVYGLLKKGCRNICTLGPIIHNPQVVKDLSQKGVTIVSNPEEAPENSTLIIRSHGVPKEIYEQIDSCGLSCVDATCPFVSRIHKIVQENSEKGALVLIAGNPDHPEVQGIKSFCRTKSYIFNSASELEMLTNNNNNIADKPCIAVAQTTFNVDEWKLCVRFIKKVYTNVIIFDTICDATSLRQQEAKQLAEKSDLMVVIGGRESSNTSKLFAVCSRICPSILIERADELPVEKLKGLKNVGVTAGASTPARIIEEVLKLMSDNNGSGNEEMSFEEALDKSFKTINTGDKVRGLVIGVSPTEVQIDVGTKHACYIPASELSDDPNVKPEQMVKEGDELDLVVLRVNDVEGTAMLSKKRVDAVKSWDDVVKASEDGTVLDGTVVETVNGGLLASYKGMKVFIPASQSGVMRNEDLNILLHKPVKFKIIEVNTQRRRAVGSIRAVLKDERKQKAEKFWSEVEIGKEYTGKVKSLTSYGAFVDLGGVDGMVHVSELSWTRIKNPSEVVAVGDVITVKVKDINPETKKISLTYKKPEDNPWEKFKAQYKTGDIIDVKIVSFVPFGAFAQVLPGVDGLIHISQISENHIAKPQEVLKIGDSVKVKITDIEPDKKRISLSMKEAASEASESSDGSADAEGPEVRTESENQ